MQQHSISKDQPWRKLKEFLPCFLVRSWHYLLILLMSSSSLELFLSQDTRTHSQRRTNTYRIFAVSFGILEVNEIFPTCQHVCDKYLLTPDRDIRKWWIFRVIIHTHTHTHKKTNSYFSASSFYRYIKSVPKKKKLFAWNSAEKNLITM